VYRQDTTPASKNDALARSHGQDPAEQAESGWGAKLVGQGLERLRWWDGLQDLHHAAAYVGGPCRNVTALVAGLALTHDALHPGTTLYLREALAEYGVDADHVEIWQTVGKLRRRHGLVLRGEPRVPRYRVEDWTWEAKRVRSSVRS
jgi:hypothetical protein